jgi:hypothetical protein
LLETLTTAFLLLYNFDEVLPGNSDVIGWEKTKVNFAQDARL